MKTLKNENLAIMEREARETRERTSTRTEARAARATEDRKSKGDSTTKKAAKRAWREQPEHRDRKPVRSLMPLRGRCAACAGRLTWERLGHLFPVLGPIQAELELIEADLARLGADSGGFAPDPGRFAAELGPIREQDNAPCVKISTGFSRVGSRVSAESLCKTTKQPSKTRPK